MKQTLKSRQGHILYEGDHTDRREALEFAVENGLKLDGIDLGGTDLRNANLDNAAISHGLFIGCDLTGANMSEAIFRDCNFTCARMVDTCLCYSDFLECNFAHTIFGSTDISMSRLDKSVFSPQAAFTLSLETAHTLSQISFITPMGQKRTSHPPIVIKKLNKVIIHLKAKEYENNISETASSITGTKYKIYC